MTDQPIVIHLLPGHPEIECSYCECIEETGHCDNCGQPTDSVVRVQGVETRDFPVCTDHLPKVIDTVGRLLAYASQGGLEQAA